MPAKEHPAYLEELQYLEYTLGYIEKALRSALHRLGKVGKDVMRLGRTYQSDNSQDYIDLMVNTKIMAGLDLKVENLEKAQQKPYFARIDFREDRKTETERLYIGKMCLMRDEDQQLVIVDWRAPVANMYYESRLGKAEYNCPAGEIRGELFLKRQFSIEAGILTEIFDIDITTNDQFLQSYLGASADNRLKDIVSTIQTEQNRVIRAAMERPLIVQGVAGSGKTTIALHRIAYLIYNYAGSFRPENFMIIAPNRLFLNYISEVLPELGVERVKQTTFADFALEVIGAKLKVMDPNEKLIRFLDPDRAADAASRSEQKASIVKSGMRFKQWLDQYLDHVERHLLPGGDFRFEKWVLFTREEIEALFYRDYRDWPLYQRVAQLRKHFQKRSKDRKDSIIAQFQASCFLEIDRLKMSLEDTPERRERVVAVIDRKNELVQKMNDMAQSGISQYLDQIPAGSALQYYREFLCGPFFTVYAGESLERETVELIRTETIKNLDQNMLEMEDLAPLMYLKYRLYGLDQKIKVKHIVIDEAQDFSPFQFDTLHRMIKGSSFTILGDLAQGIHSYRGTRDWNEVRREVFQGECTVLNLQQSYRTTIEIMDAANTVIGHLAEGNLLPAEPVIRHGAPVAIIPQESYTAVSAAIEQEIGQFQKLGYKSFAIVGKTLAECRTVTRCFAGKPLRPVLITGKEKEYRSGFVAVPSYLVKGLEFDVVFIANADERNYRPNDLDVKLLYVAATRPLHRLLIYHIGELTPLLRGV